MKIFVPGRICLFGEHSDWAGGYRRINAGIEKGYTVITGTNQGIHAEVRPRQSRLILRSALSDGTRMGPFELPMDRDALLEEAEKGGFFSYAAGVAFQVLTHYRVGGLEIDNYLTDLPVKKGLSSSAAVCVLVARAFNRIYDLKMTVRGEMEFAYMGEITTPSRCGRMDQGCAYGERPVLMVFDGERIDVREFSVDRDLYFVIVDLCASKDTREILNKLNRSYPFADGEVQRGVQKYLGPVNKDIVHRALEALRAGDAESTGRIMREAQEQFDKYLQPACPSQLTAPVLHKVLGYEPVQPYIFGGKGVGSQGDGTAQLLCRDEAAQAKVIEILERDLQVDCVKLTVSAGRCVRKAVIPAAGFGTRLFPATKGIKKELFPIIDNEGRAKPVILVIIEEALSAGIEEVCIIVQKDDLHIFEEYFKTPPRAGHYNKLSKDDQRYSQYLLEVGRRVTFLPQEVQEGFGHAVWCAREWAGDEPFLLLLGDHIYKAGNEASCARQLLDLFDRSGVSVVGLKSTPAAGISKFGCVGGAWREAGQVLNITEFAEKPDLDYAREFLRVEAMDEDEFLTVFGLYVIKPGIFEYLDENIRHNVRERGEFQLTSCLDRLRQEDGFLGRVVQGRRFDIGRPDAYRQTLIDFRNA